MPGLDPGIHDFLCRGKDVDGRDKPGHDEGLSIALSYAKLSINAFNLGAHRCASSPDAE
jgi:hypothetical protein